ncbi:MAG: glutamine--fructose-6-phosphate transaminase (isomerizing), partial [Euryarchaeota archaeon]|nr:glutamine--fructose-6-phosphate transaminase (isomerizing) [Euryarchaeota archaeon]
QELREKLESKGHVFVSETDTECLVHLLEEAYEGDLKSALIKALREVDGSYALLVVSQKEPDMILAARHESPLMLGIGDGEMFAGSDVAPFLEHTKKVVPLDDGEGAVITRDGYQVFNLGDGSVVEKDVVEVDWDLETAEKEGYPHFMLKEIFEQPRTVTEALNVYPEDIRRLAEMIGDAGRVYLSAAGTSLHAAKTAEYWFAKLCSTPATAVDSSEMAEVGVIDGETLVIGITQSGETYDTLASLRHARRKGAKVATIVNVVGSTATRSADHAVLQGSGIEISVCATKTFTSQLVILLRTALALARLQGKGHAELERELERVPELIGEVLELNREIQGVAERYCNVGNYLYIGKGINNPSALEGALKFKEITYRHAEGMSGGLLKHGTISLIDDDMVTVAMVPASGENRLKIQSNIQEVKARGGVVIGITSGKPVEQCDACIVVPECSEVLSPLVFAPAYQLLAYHTAVQLGRNVDKPRALAKSVTVE